MYYLLLELSILNRDILKFSTLKLNLIFFCMTWSHLHILHQFGPGQLDNICWYLLQFDQFLGKANGLRQVCCIDWADRQERRTVPGTWYSCLPYLTILGNTRHASFILLPAILNRPSSKCHGGEEYLRMSCSRHDLNSFCSFLETIFKELVSAGFTISC